MNELQKRAKAHRRKQKGMSPFSSLNPNAGDENINTQAFNSAMGGTGCCEDFVEDNEYDDEVGEYFSNAYIDEDSDARIERIKNDLAEKIAEIADEEERKSDNLEDKTKRFVKGILTSDNHDGFIPHNDYLFLKDEESQSRMRDKSIPRNINFSNFWVDFIESVAHKVVNNIRGGIKESAEGHKLVKVNTKSHYANSPFFWDLYDYAEDHDIDVDYEERKDREGNYYVTRFELYGLDSDIDKMFDEFKDLKKNCKVYNA